MSSAARWWARPTPWRRRSSSPPGEAEIDAALLDINLGGQPVFAIADALRARGVPTIFSTGYGESGLRDVDRGAPVLQKPFRAADLETALKTALKVDG